jgi:acetylornithine/succinyldiaminopimelate/putrescine aminotransferase
MIGIELKERVAPYLEELQERGILAMPAGRKVLRLLPPLVITEEELAQVVFQLEEVLTSKFQL